VVLPPRRRLAPAERQLLDRVADGPVLDLGCGAGRVALHLQDAGQEVVAVDNSPGAIAVAAARGVMDARLADLRDPPSDRPWRTVLLMCGNLGLAGGWDDTRSLLRRLHEITALGAQLLCDSFDPTLLTDDHSRAHAERNRANGDPPGLTTLRLRYGELVSPWWQLLNVTIDEAPLLVDGTGWAIDEQLVVGAEHYLALRHRPPT
jgi:SAM-dependent methyltransferase